MYRATFFTVLLTVAGIALGQAMEPPFQPDPAVGTGIANAAAFDGRLWVRGLNGALVSFDLDSGARAVPFGKGVAALDKHAGRLFVLVAKDRPEDLALEEWKQGAFADVAAIALPKAAPWLILAWVRDRPMLVTPDAVWTFNGKGGHVLRVKLDTRRMPPMLQPDAAAITADGLDLYLGYNGGEWGGGTTRVDLATGAVLTSAEAYAAAGKTDTVLADGDITALIPDPADPHCVVAAEGLIHFFASGRVVKICRTGVTPVFERKIDAAQTHGDTEAFFGLVPAESGYWALSHAAVYRFGAAGAPRRFVLGKFARWHGLLIDREVPGALVLLTDANGRFSVNNGTPLIVPLD